MTPSDMPSAAPKSVLVVNLKSLPTWHVDLCAGFNAIGVAARAFLVQPQTLAERVEKSFFSRKWSDSSLVLNRLVETCRQFRPDMIMFLGLLVLPERIIEGLRRNLDYQPLFCSWVCDCFPDPQFNDWVTADHVFYFDTFLETILPRFYSDPSTRTFLPLAADTARYRKLASSDKRGGSLTTQGEALVFVGNVSPNRADVLAQIRDHIPLVVLGPNAGRSKLRRRSKLSSEAINKIYNTHAVVLNINQSPNTEYGANLRTFEVPAAASLLLTQHSLDLPQHFEPGVEILSYANTDELVELYQRCIADRAWSQRVAAAGHQRVKAAHTFTHRARAMLAALA